MPDPRSLLVVVVVATLIGASVPAAATVTPMASGQSQAAFGESLTAYLQSAVAAANGSVESGMWAVAFNRANESKQARLAHNQTARLERRLDRLRERNATLHAKYRNGTIAERAYRIRASKLSGRIAALRASINRTATVTDRAGLNISGIAKVRRGARNMSAPRVPGVAHGVVAGGPPPNVTRGPPAHAGPPSDAGPPGNRSAGPPNGTGPPGSAGPPNGTGPPGSAGPPNGTGPPGEPGSPSGPQGAGTESGPGTPGGDGQGPPSPRGP